MEAYTDFAELYDTFMEEVPYELWRNKIIKILSDYGIDNGLIAELGCGTGTMTRLLSRSGYDMIGIDNSSDMLRKAVEKRGEDNILYLCQDMREFELFGTVRAVISVCDSINYIPDSDELLNVFKLVNLYLDPGGLFIFDFNTPYRYESIGDATIAENRDEGSFIWENIYDFETMINQSDITMFQKVLSESDNVDGCSDMYRKFSEKHLQRGYTLEHIKALLDKAGLVFLEAYDAYGNGEPNDYSERILIAARESGK